MMFFWFFEVALVVLGISFGAPSPVGVVPYPDDPALVRAAPTDSLVYVQWNGNAQADPRSSNTTEQLAAQPEVREFIRRLTTALTEAAVYENRRDAQAALQTRAMMTELWKTLAVPGCLFVANTGGFIRPDKWHVGLVSARGKAAKATATMVGAGLQMLGLELSDADADGFRQTMLPEVGLPLRIGAAGDHLVLTMGVIDTKGVVARLAGEDAGPGLAANPRFQANRASVAVERPSVRTFLDLQRARELAGPLMGEEGQRILTALGLGSTRAMLSESGLEGNEFASRMALVTPDRNGILAMVGGRSLAYADLEIVPADADLALAVRVEPKTLLTKIRGVMDGIEPGASRELERELDRFTRQTGVSLAEQVLPHCGDTLLAWSAPSQGGLLFTGLTFALRVDDAEKLRASLNQFMKGAPMKPVAPRRRGEQVRKMRVAGQTVYWLNTVGDDVPMAPAWCVSDTHFLFSFFPQTLKSTLQAGVGRPDSLAMAQKVKPTKNTIALGYANTANAFKIGYPLLLPLGQLFCSEMQREGLPLTMDALPTAESVVPYATRVVANLEAKESGFRFERLSGMPFNDPGVAVVTCLTFTGMFWVGGAVLMGEPIVVKELAVARAPRPAAEAAREAASEAVEMAEIAQLQRTLTQLRAKLRGILPTHPSFAETRDRVRKLEATLAMKRKALDAARKQRATSRPGRGKLAPGQRAPAVIPPQRADVEPRKKPPVPVKKNG